MRKAVFETATLVDAIAKANRVAPVKGAGADMAAGIVIVVDPLSLTEQVVVMATDLEVSFRQVVSVLEVGDEPATWRVPAGLCHGLMGTLNMESGSQTMIADNDGVYLHFRSGKTKAKLRLIVGEYPKIPTYKPQDLPIVQNLAKRLKQVSWATRKKGDGILSGVHMDGEYLVATDASKSAIVPCVVPIEHPVTAPLADIASLIKNTGEVRMRARDTYLEVSPDIYTQTTSRLLAGQDYPNFRQILDYDKYNGSVTVNAESLKSALERMLVITKAEKMPVTTIKIGLNVMHLEMEEPEVGKIADEIECTGGSTEEFLMSFTPQNLADAVNASGRPTVILDYGPTSHNLVRVRDDNEFVSVLTPRRLGS